ncbi:MAG: hypothetical protein K6A41_04460 [Bacteroidales bacterium]|nr:hypothetical protein [Bacteroidales bacterium]
MYKSSDDIIPFWGEKISSKNGRDPLAIQNSSVVIYVKMISGITNVTTRVRYNGFYCWLLNLISNRLFKPGSTLMDTPKEQIKYLRRGELLLAYVMQYCYPQVTGVGGSNYTSKQLFKGIFNIAKGADLDNKDTAYWKGKLGVFGQYYVGAMARLRLVKYPDASHRSYRVAKPNGINLSSVFSKSLTKEIEDLFWEAIHSGEISEGKLRKLNKLALHLIDDKDELDEYQKIFSATDEIDNETNHTFSTIKLLMTFIKGEGFSVKPKSLVLSFLRYNFLETLKENFIVKNEQLSWFMYELNELTHAAYEAYHFAILYSTTEDSQPLDLIIGSIERGFKECESLTETIDGIYELYNKMQSCYKTKEYGELVYFASQLLISLFKSIEKDKDKLNSFGIQEGYYRHPGFAPTLLERLVGTGDRICDWPMAENCIYSAINDHLYSSYTKSSIGQGVVHNYMVDDGLIWRLRLTEPVRTSPRLQNVLQYIEDMKWIERDAEDCYVLTERGTEIMQVK